MNTEGIDHVSEAAMHESADWAQVHATLALVEQVAKLVDAFGQCEHGYSVCPFCIRNAIEGGLS